MAQRNFKLQELRKTSSTARHKVGTLWEDPITGYKYRYIRAGATALNPGRLQVAAAINAAHMNQTIGAAVAIGTVILNLTVTAGTAIAENALRNGQFAVNDGTGQGYSYLINGNSALTAAGTSIVVTLDTSDPIKVALDAASEFTLVHNPSYAVVESATAAKSVGVTMCDIAANYYGWVMSKGLHGAVLVNGTPGVGYHVVQGLTTAGSVDIMANGATEEYIGTIHGTVGVSTEFKPVWLRID